MCMEDYQIGRETQSRFGFTNVLTTATEILPGNPKRTALIIFAGNGGRLTVGDNNQVALDAGPTIVQGANGILLNIIEHGDIVRHPIWGINAVSGNVGFIETQLQRE